MDCQYIVFSSTFEAGCLSRTSYGIALVSVADDVMSVLQTLADVSSDRKGIDRLVDRCNTLKLDPMHLDEIVENFLQE